MAHNTTASLEKLSFTVYVDFGKCQDRFGLLSWSEIDSNNLNVRLKCFNRDNDSDSHLVQNFTMGDASFNQFLRLRSQLVIAAEGFGTEEILSPVLISTMFKELDEQLKLAHKLIDVVYRANRKICVNLLRYNVEKPKRSNAQVQLLAKTNADEKFQQNVHMKYIFQEFIYLLNVMSFVYNKVFTNATICNVL